LPRLIPQAAAHCDAFAPAVGFDKRYAEMVALPFCFEYMHTRNAKATTFRSTNLQHCIKERGRSAVGAAPYTLGDLRTEFRVDAEGSRPTGINASAQRLSESTVGAEESSH